MDPMGNGCFSIVIRSFSVFVKHGSTRDQKTVEKITSGESSKLNGRGDSGGSISTGDWRV